MSYYNQTATWSHAGTPNAYNEPTYTTTTIACRLEGTSQLVLNSAGETVVSGARLFTASAILVDDMVNGRQVLKVDAPPRLDGTIHHYEVFLK